MLQGKFKGKIGFDVSKSNYIPIRDSLIQDVFKLFNKTKIS